MSQAVINAILSKRLIQIQSQQIKQNSPKESPLQITQRILDLCELIIKLKNEGTCIAYSLIHAVMDEEGFLEWWENALVTIANFDGDLLQLEKEIELPLADKNAKWRKANEEGNTKEKLYVIF